MANINKGLMLEEISKQLDISPTMYKLAVERYSSVSKYLEKNGIEANFYPQGSFRLGTVTRPIKNGEESDYDIDLVCQMFIEKTKTSPSIIKNAVGDLLKQNTQYKEILDDEGRRCWTLLYAEKDGIGFHLDILPSVGESTDIIQDLLISHKVRPIYVDSVIAITHKKDNSYSWTSSNPRGYGDWFDEINKPFYSLIEKDAKKLLFENNRNIFASIDDVPTQLVRTPLQRVIQILKRHRDLRFNGHEYEEDKPISMIITTLTSLIVKNENCATVDPFTLLNFIVTKLAEYAELINNSNAKIAQQQNSIIKRDVTTNRWYIPNPVNPSENFADRWHENNNRKAKAFFDWVKWVSTDLIGSLNNPDFAVDSLKPILGSSVIEKVHAKYKAQFPHDNNNNRHIPATPTVNITSPGKPWRD